MSIVGKIKTTDSVHYQFSIQKNEQNSFKGVLWGMAGTYLLGTSLLLTTASVMFVPAAVISFRTLTISDSMANNIIGYSILAFVGVSAVTALTNYLANNYTGCCFKNAIYHFGPEFQIVSSKIVSA